MKKRPQDSSMTALPKNASPPKLCLTSSLPPKPPKGPQEAPKRAPGGPKRPPRGPQKASKGPKEATKMLPNDLPKPLQK